jgi:2-oxoglutarate dehydrogenase E2 component (dihydrolipoamide succinyltransferase)
MSGLLNEIAAIVEVRAPSEQSEGTRSQLLRWLKAVGQPVAKNEPLIEVETDKVTVEIPAPADGVLTAILKQPQEEIAPGELLAQIGPRAAGAAPESTAPAGVARAAGSAGSGSTASPAAPISGQRALISPAVRKLLTEHSVDAALVTGSGAGGRISAEDVLRYVAERLEPEPAPQSGVRRVPHSATRKVIAQRMVQSLLHTAPHVTSVFEADFTAVLAHRARHRATYLARATPLTITAYLLSACVDAIRAVPEANARWTEHALEIFDQVDIGVATAVAGKGLVVPVVRSVQSLDLAAIAAELERLISAARTDRLTPADVRAGTFTISNHGVSGSLLAAPVVINPPQVAILGVGKIERRAVVLDIEGQESIVPRSRAYLSLTIDHRAMDGEHANRFLSALVQRLESWPLLS